MWTLSGYKELLSTSIRLLSIIIVIIIIITTGHHYQDYLTLMLSLCSKKGLTNYGLCLGKR